MYCPSCGSEERQASQFCRACGVDMRAVRMSLERPDSITASAVSARDEIGRAVADRIRSVADAAELKIVADSVLPQVEKFLESPEEKRLRRVRAGTIISATGLGAGTLGLIMSAVVTGPDIEAALWIGGLGITAFTLGLGFILNGLLFTKPRKALDDRSPDARMPNVLDAGYQPPASISDARATTTSNLASEKGASVTEHTTLNLKKD
ncbi:MAG: zinc ribbon domain-containing protein [Pyrinomonadaceae bacterium]